MAVEFWMNIGPFLLAVIAVIVNGVPQLLYAQARGFALSLQDLRTWWARWATC